MRGGVGGEGRGDGERRGLGAGAQGVGGTVRRGGGEGDGLV